MVSSWVGQHVWEEHRPDRTGDLEVWDTTGREEELLQEALDKADRTPEE